MTDTITYEGRELPARPITVLVAALGGEGGGVLADWLVAAATAAGYPVQSTSIPGVAQRTGATTYYVEVYPAKREALDGRRPVLALTPSPGNVDLMVASELVEAGRAMQNGFVSPERTTLVASTHRIYTVAEKMAMGDGRADTDRIVKAAGELAQRTVLFDMADATARAGTVISAVMFGAIAGANVLPLSRAECEEAIRRGGKGVDASLRGFALGYAHATGEAAAPSPAELKAWRTNPAERVRSAFPGETHRILEEGVARTTDYQDAAYATLYLDRLEPIAKLDRDNGGGATGFKLTNETGRFLALWMCYEDVIRVADLKSRRSRFERVRAEVQAKPGEPVHIVEYLKPGVEEVAAVLPPRALPLADRLGRPPGAHRQAERRDVREDDERLRLPAAAHARRDAAFAPDDRALPRRAGADRPLARRGRRRRRARSRPRARDRAVRTADQGLRRDAPARQGELPAHPGHDRGRRDVPVRHRAGVGDQGRARGGARRPRGPEARSVARDGRHRPAAAAGEAAHVLPPPAGRRETGRVTLWKSRSRTRSST